MGAVLAKESAPLCWFEVVDVGPSVMSCFLRPCLFLGSGGDSESKRAQGRTKSGGGLQKKGIKKKRRKR